MKLLNPTRLFVYFFCVQLTDSILGSNKTSLYAVFFIFREVPSNLKNKGKNMPILGERHSESWSKGEKRFHSYHIKEDNRVYGFRFVIPTRNSSRSVALNLVRERCALIKWVAVVPYSSMWPTCLNWSCGYRILNWVAQLQLM